MQNLIIRAKWRSGRILGRKELIFVNLKIKENKSSQAISTILFQNNEIHAILIMSISGLKPGFMFF